MAKAERYLTLELIEQPHGRCHANLTSDDGTVLLDREYKNRNSARNSVDYQLKRLGLTRGAVRLVSGPEPEVVPVDTATGNAIGPDLEPEPAPEPVPSAPASPTDRWLVELRHEAQRTLEQALKLREQADALELEHKRLTAAADVLEGPEA